MTIEQIDEYLKERFGDNWKVLSNFVSSLFEADEDHVLIALARIQTTFESKDLPDVIQFCLRQSLEFGSATTRVAVFSFFRYDASIRLPIKVMYRRRIVEEIEYETEASVPITELCLDSDGAPILKPGANVSFDKFSLERKRQRYITSTDEASEDPDASHAVCWRKTSIYFRRKT